MKLKVTDKKPCNKEEIKIDYLIGCAACGGRHNGLIAKRFKRAPTCHFDAEGDGPYDHWTTCPTNGDPILVYATE